MKYGLTFEIPLSLIYCFVFIAEDVLKKKWKHLKDQYRKELKKKPDSRSGAEANDWLSSWKYFQSMEFMRHEVMPAPSSGNLNPVEVEGNVDIPNEEDSTDVDIDMVDSVAASPASQQSPAPSTSQPTPISRKKGNMREEMLEIEKKIKLMEKRLNQSNEEENLRNDADYLFLRSILPSMKKLSEYQKLRFRGKINDWLLEALTPSQNSNSFYVNQPYYAQPGNGDTRSYFPQPNTGNTSSSYAQNDFEN